MVWGEGILQNDHGSDFEIAYNALIEKGIPKELVIEMLYDEYIEVCPSEVEFWLITAAVQLKHGEVDSRIKEAAIKVIDENNEIEKWAYNKDLMIKRKRNLSELKQQLLSLKK